MPKQKKEGTVVAASMASGAGGGLGAGLSGKAIEDAMAAAVVKALNDGVTDPAKILKLKLAAREKVKDDHRAALARAEKAAKAK